MDRRQTLEAIFTSSANSNRLPPPAPSRISAALSHEHTSLFPHFHPSQTIGCHCSSKYPNNMLFFSKLGCISELSMMGLKMTSIGPFDFRYTVACNMFRYERSGKRERIQKKKSHEWSLVSAGGLRRKTSSEFRVWCSAPVVCHPSRLPSLHHQQKKRLLRKKKIGWVNLREQPESVENNLA